MCKWFVHGIMLENSYDPEVVMFYPNTMVGTFLSRPNRFLAHVMLNETEVVCHVKNTGRLKELLIPGVPVVVQHHPDAIAAGRKTEYSVRNCSECAVCHGCTVQTCPCCN